MVHDKKLKDLMPPSVRTVGDIEKLEIKGLTADSRKVEPGFIFFAIKGTHADGRDFIEKAIEKGAVAVFTEEEGLASACAVPVLCSNNPRRDLSLMAARFFGKAPQTIAAVTGTSGKTSVAAFLRQIWSALGYEAASIGTIGIKSAKTEIYGSLTTPDPVDLHKNLYDLAEEGVTHLVMEASSHGLDQFRLDGVPITLGAFTNLGRDHMDYHSDIKEYFDAKMRLFRDLLDKGCPAIVDPKAPFGEEALDAMAKAGLDVQTVGEAGHSIRLINVEYAGTNQILTLDFGDGPRVVTLPLVGAFQVSNALTAAGLAFASGGSAIEIALAMEKLVGEKGRLEFVGNTRLGARVFVDYAHKVEALENVLDALRPFATNRLIVVFGAGGNRDQGKRPLMGKAARERADIVIVTDDNPRYEQPDLIRQAILKEVPEATEIAAREEAILHAIGLGQEGDVIVIAGKGHEPGQIVGDRILPFSDHEVVARALYEEGQ